MFRTPPFPFFFLWKSTQEKIYGNSAVIRQIGWCTATFHLRISQFDEHFRALTVRMIEIKMHLWQNGIYRRCHNLKIKRAMAPSPQTMQSLHEISNEFDVDTEICSILEACSARFSIPLSEQRQVFNPKINFDNSVLGWEFVVVLIKKMEKSTLGMWM